MIISYGRVMREAQINWLLDEFDPSVRYFTLRDILEKGEDDPQVMEARRKIPESGVIQKILKKQQPEGYWEKPFNPYLPKYKSSYWVIMALGQLGMDRTDERVVKACEYIFQFQTPEGAFISQTRETLLREYELRLRKGRKLPPRDEWVSGMMIEQQLSCLTGNMAAALIRLGYEDDPRVHRALN